MSERTGACRLDRPVRCTTSARGSYIVVHPARRARRQRSESSQYMKNRSSNPPSARNTSARIIVNAPLTQSTFSAVSGEPNEVERLRRESGLPGLIRVSQEVLPPNAVDRSGKRRAEG